MDIRFLIWITLFGYGWSFPTDKVKETSKTDVKDLENSVTTNSTCRYKGSTHVEGDVIEIEEPCLSCLCRKGSLICNLRVCPDLPEPPPQGCVIVHKQKHCCPQLLCDSEAKENQIEIRTESRQVGSLDNNGCIVNGSLYAEGSALASSSLCEYCYCIRGQQKCIKPHCVLPLEGCTPHYKEHSCCPTYYDCRGNATTNSTVQLPNYDCERDGITYAQGEMVPSRDNSTCENCYCMKGQIRCVPITCSMEFFEGCEPVHTPGQCCPSSYKCTKAYTKKKSELHEVVKNSIRSFIGSSDENKIVIPVSDRRSYAEPEISTEMENTTVTEEMTTETTEAQTTTEEPEKTRKEITTLIVETEPTVIPSNISMEERIDHLETTTELQLNISMEERIDHLESATELNFQETTTQVPVSEITTVTDDLKTTFEPNNATAAPVTENETINITISSRLDYAGDNESRNANVTETDVVSNTPNADDNDYDAYDYSEPKLPPSLPNLVIYPFVAADAVTKDDTPKSPNYDPNSIKRTDVDSPEFYKEYFSPPRETEGGFVPKAPILQNGYETPYPEKEGTEVEESPALFPPAITLPPKLKTEHCFADNREYSHGEVLAESAACTQCVCFYGEVICQETPCPKVQYGCRRTPEKEPNSCCGKVVCDLEPPKTDDPDHPDLKPPTPTIHITTIVPPVTIADTIDVTPDPFKDVIRTEPAPDLPSLMSDLLPFYVDHQTKKPVSVTYKNVVVDYYPDFHVTTTREQSKKPEINKTPVYYQTQISNGTSTEATTEINNATDFVRTSIRPVVQETTEPSIQSLNVRTPTIEHVKITKMPQSPSPTKTFTRKPLISIRPKETTVVPTSESSFFDEFFKDIFDSNDSNKATTTTRSLGTKHKYSAKIKSKTTTEPTFNKTVNITATEKSDQNVVDDSSFSLDSVFQLFFNPETTSTTLRSITKPKYRNNTRKPIKKVTPRPVKLQTTTVPTTETTTKNETEETSTSPLQNSTIPTLESREDVDDGKQAHSSFVTDGSGFPKIQILKQDVEKTDTKSNQKNKFNSTRKPSPDLGNLLKLAGCNIYGRMYRVGKIITELSGPCLECMCTDFGVQCNPLSC